jgi:hypothetical protein
LHWLEWLQYFACYSQRILQWWHLVYPPIWYTKLLKSNANLVINTTCMLLYLSRAIYIFECKNLVYKIFFWVSYFRPWFLWPETKKLVIPFLYNYLIASLLSVHCVSPHRRSHKPHRISILKTKYHLLWLPPWTQPIVEYGSSIQGRSQDGANIEDFKYLSKGKVFSVPTLSLSPLCQLVLTPMVQQVHSCMSVLEFNVYAGF